VERGGGLIPIPDAQPSKRSGRDRSSLSIPWILIALRRHLIGPARQPPRR
jgi:hypothetical protein